MRAGAATMAVLALLVTGACSDRDRSDLAAARSQQPPLESAPAARPAGEATAKTPFDSALAAQGLLLDNAGRLAAHSAAGFEVYWPTGCGQLRTGEPEVVDPTVRQEFHYACDRFDKEGRGCSVYVIQNAQDENGGPPTPAMVVHHVTEVLKHYGVRPDRQRPLQSPGFEGVEVQAVQPAGKGEVWVRGLLAGPNVYVLTAWNNDGGLFADIETKDFFASFRLIQ